MFTTILAPVDGTPASQKALTVARDLAEKYGAKITLMHVLPLPMLELLSYRTPMAGADLLPQQVEERLRHDSDHILEQARELVGAENLATSRAELGHPAQLIVETAEQQGFSLVVMGSRGLGRLSGYIMGSVSEYVVSHCHVPVLVVKT